jgi:recombination endonuclease VII
LQIKLAKECPKCHKRDKGYPVSRKKGWCYDCLNEWQRNYRRTRPKEYWKDKDRRYAIKKRYGVTLESIREMDLAQGGRCAVCSGDPAEINKTAHHRVLHVDHNHATGRVRGLLCNPCNRAIGFVRDNPEIARKLADYLERTDS